MSNTIYSECILTFTNTDMGSELAVTNQESDFGVMLDSWMKPIYSGGDKDALCVRDS